MSKCKYEMREHQVSYDDGLTWTALEVIKGDLIEYQSADCPDSGSEITKWVDLENDFLCEENRKYKKQILYVSYDDGVTWYIYFPTVYQKGEYVGVDKSFCNNKFEGQYIYKKIDPLKIVKCNDSSTLSFAETQYYVSSCPLISGKIGNCVTSIGNSAFSGCTSLSSVTFEQGSQLVSIGYSAFRNCTSLTSIDIPSGVTSIGSYAFSSCSGLTSVTIPSGVTSIGDSAFEYCRGLTSITINATTPPTLGAFVFSSTNNCPIYVPCQLVEVYKTAPYWSGYASRIQGGVYRWIDDGTMCDNANKYNKEKQQVSCDSGTTWIDTGQVRKKSEIPIETDSYECGYRTRTLTSLTICIDKDLYELDEYQESRDSGLTWVTTATSATTLIESGASECEFTGKFKATYSDSTTYSAECNSSIELTTATTRAHSTSYTAMTTAEIGACVRNIGNYAFESCESLISVTIGSGVRIIGSGVFRICSSLTSIIIPSGVTSIGDYAFEVCSRLTSIVIPDSVRGIGDRAFSGCTSLTSCTIGSGVTSFGHSVFNHCSGLTSIVIPSGVTSITESLFGYCTSLTSIDIPSGVTYIGIGAFQGCSSLTSIVIPSGVTKIGQNVFSGCTSLTSIDIPSGVTSIGVSAFYGCSGLTSIDIPSGVTSIGSYAFYGCSGLTSITINATTPPTLGSSALNYTNDCPIYVPSTSVNAYKSARGWIDYASRIQPIPNS